MKYLYSLIIVCFMISGCAKPPAPKYSERREVMGTFVQMDICSNQVNPDVYAKAYQAVWNRFDQINERMSSYRPDSEVSQINQSYVVDGHPETGVVNPISVSSDTFYVLKRSKYFHDISNGAFDITVWNLMKFWRQKAKENEMPLKSEIDQIQKYRGMRFLEFLPNNEVINTGLYTQVDLGGIAKGYAIDEAARLFREYGIENFYIDAGGDVYVGGLNCEGKFWRIGIRDPHDRSKLMEVIQVSNQAVTTSGNYEQHFDIQGKQYSHIIDPTTGYPQEDVVSATVIAASATDADALSTSLTVLGVDRGAELIERLGDGYAALILSQGLNGNSPRRKATKNYQKFASK